VRHRDVCWAAPQAAGCIKDLEVAIPFLFEAACIVMTAVAVLRSASLAAATPSRQRSQDRRALSTVLHAPGVVLMGVTSALLTAIQVGVLVFLFPLYLLTRAGLEPTAVGTVVSLSVLGPLMALWLGGTVSDRWGRNNSGRSQITGSARWIFSQPFPGTVSQSRRCAAPNWTSTNGEKAWILTSRHVRARRRRREQSGGRFA
jgi:hypothetical protein